MEAHPQVGVNAIRKTPRASRRTAGRSLSPGLETVSVPYATSGHALETNDFRPLSRANSNTFRVSVS